jgi:hypothetical protein
MSKKNPYGIALLAIVLLPVVVAAQSPFDGTWKQDLSKSKIHMKPLVYLLQDGMYHCESCPAPFTIKADGQDHKVSGMAWMDTMSVKVVDDHTIELVSKKDGRVTNTQKRTVSADGNSLTEETTDTTVAVLLRSPANPRGSASPKARPALTFFPDPGMPRTWALPRRMGSCSRLKSQATP